MGKPNRWVTFFYIKLTQLFGLSILIKIWVETTMPFFFFFFFRVNKVYVNIRLMGIVLKVGLVTRQLALNMNV